VTLDVARYQPELPCQIVEECILTAMGSASSGTRASGARKSSTADVLIPRCAPHRGTTPKSTAAAHKPVTDSGIVVVTVDDEPYIGPLSEEALRFEAEAGPTRWRRVDIFLDGDSMKIAKVQGAKSWDSARNPTGGSRRDAGRRRLRAARRCRRAPRPPRQSHTVDVRDPPWRTAFATVRALSPSRSSSASRSPVEAPDGTAARAEGAAGQRHVDFPPSGCRASPGFRALANLRDPSSNLRQERLSTRRHLRRVRFVRETERFPR